MAGNLEVMVINAQNLKDVESFGRMDPFVVLELSGQKFQTKSKTDGGKHPQWNERFTFNTIDPTYSTELVVKVSDRNTVASDTEVGVGRVPLCRIYQQAPGAVETRVSLTTAKGKSAGELLLLLTFKPHKQAAPAPATPTAAAAPPPAVYAASPPPVQQPLMVVAPAPALAPMQQAPPAVMVAATPQGTVMQQQQQLPAVVPAPAYMMQPQQMPQQMPQQAQQQRYVAPASIAFPETYDYSHSYNTYKAGPQAPVMAAPPAAPVQQYTVPAPPMPQPPQAAYMPPPLQQPGPTPAYYTPPAAQSPMPVYAPPVVQPAAPAFAPPTMQPPAYFPQMQPPMPTYPQPPAYSFPGSATQGMSWPPPYPSSDAAAI